MSPEKPDGSASSSTSKFYQIWRRDNDGNASTTSPSNPEYIDLSSDSEAEIYEDEGVAENSHYQGMATADESSILSNFADGCSSSSSAYHSFQNASQSAEPWNEIDRAESSSPGQKDSSDSDYIVISSDSEAVLSDKEDLEESPKKKKLKKKRVSMTQKLPDDNDTETYFKRIENLPSCSESVQDFKTFDLSKDSKQEWKLDKEVFEKCYDYQQKGVEWLLEKYEKNIGGILADEMGLGKTIQTICFLRAIEETGQYNFAVRRRGLGRALLICPASVMHQWIREAHKWFPKCRVIALHASSSTGVTNKVLKLVQDKDQSPHGCVLLTTYSMFVRYSTNINSIIWSVAILDEGHKIKNTGTKNYKEVSKIATPRRFILSGSPIQNNLSELWTLVEFIFPGRLGSFNAFSESFIKKIQSGSYSTSTLDQKEIAYKCAVILQMSVKPLILRRLKSDLREKLALTDKHEQILFCNLTARQRTIYETYLKSEEVQKIFAGKMDGFVGLTKMSHICNHPGIYEKLEPDDHLFGSYRDSGKMAALMKLLNKWQGGDNKVLIYSQKKSVIRMLEFVFEQKEYTYLTMTGETAVAQRDGLVEKFKNDASIFCFLLTTKTGGIGLNLTAANRIVIFDPDWNPTTDQQAKERAWRIGQTRDVVIYRLITSGTIEEKMYMRQIHKEFLSARVLEKARTRQIIPKESLRDLFRLTPEGVTGSEAGIYVEGEVIPKERKRKIKEEVEDEKDPAENGSKPPETPSKKKIKKSCLADFEDRKTLAALFEGNVLSSIITHEKAVMHEQDRMALEINARQHARDAAKILIHADERSSRNWEQQLLNKFSDKKKHKKEQNKEVESNESFWSTINKNMKRNDGSKELERCVDISEDLLFLFHRSNMVLKDKTVRERFDTKKITGIDSFYFTEILNTLAKYNDTDKTWKLRSKYAKLSNR